MVGCSPSIAITTPKKLTTITSKVTETSKSTTYIPAVTSTSEIEARLMNDTWVSPAEVNISKFYAGARAEWTIKIHNGNDLLTRTEKYSVTTEPLETKVPIKIKKPLANGDFSGVIVTSDSSKDNLKAVAYNIATKEITFTGFAANIQRIITVQYDAWSQFFVKYMASNEAREGYALAPKEAESWVIIENPTPILAPKETKEITVALDIPKGAVIPDKQWEFWTVAGELGTGTVQLEYATRWTVIMK